MNGFWTQFEQYVRSYLPDWQYQRGGSEPEAALMTVLGEMLQASRQRLDQLPEKHLREYLSAWYQGPQPAEPVYTYASLSAPQGMVVARGTRFYRSGDGARLWETTADACAEAGKLCMQFLSSGSLGKVVPLPVPTDQEPGKLFDFHMAGIQRREVRFRHPAAFSSQGGCTVGLTLEGATDGLLRFLCDPACAAWYLETEGRMLPLAPPAPAEQTLRFCLPASHGAPACLLLKAADDQVPPPTAISRAVVETVRRPKGQTVLLTDAGPGQSRDCLPFGDRLTQWNTCYVSCPDALALPGAQVTLSWLQSHRTREELLPGMDQPPQYRPVMRRMPQAPPAIRDVRADGVLWEYWNGRTWRVIPGSERYTQAFSQPDGGQAIRREAAFTWPADAQPCMVQGLNTHWLRWRLAACEGAGWLPARYHAPLLTDVAVCGALSGDEASIEQRCGVGQRAQPLSGPRKLLFPSITPSRDCWWLGFDIPPESDCFHLYLSLRGHVPGGRLSACEGTPGGGMRPLALLDGTDGLAHSGMLSVTGIQGRRSVRFGMDGWWLCLQEESGAFQDNSPKPVLTGLAWGAVLLRGVADDRCDAGEPFYPLHGGCVSARSLSHCFGGAPRESDAGIVRRLQQQRHHLDRIVSPSDAQQLICANLRDVAGVRCVRRGTALHIAVLMRDTAHHAAAFQLRKAAIRQLVTHQSPLPTLGLEVEIREPSFYPIHVMAWLDLEGEAEFSQVKGRVEGLLHPFLDPVAGGFGGGGWPIGALPTLSQIRTCLQSALPDGSLTELVVSTTTPDGSERDPTAIHDPFALPLGGACTIYTIGKGGRSV